MIIFSCSWLEKITIYNFWSSTLRSVSESQQQNFWSKRRIGEEHFDDVSINVDQSGEYSGCGARVPVDERGADGVDGEISEGKKGGSWGVGVTDPES